MRRSLSYLLATCFLLLPIAQARATFVGLGDGTQDVTLTCIFINCPGPFTGTVTISGAQATDWFFHTAFDVSLTFNGDPDEIVGPPPLGSESLQGLDSTDAYQLRLIAGGTWHIFIGGVDVDRGTWTAVPHQSTVTEPGSLTLLLPVLAAIGVGAVRRRK